ALLVRALVSPQLGRWELAPVAIAIVAAGIADKTLFLAARAEHYWTTVMVFVLASDWIPGAKAVQAALWFWAGVSKLNRHFPSVICVMTSNSPFTQAWLRMRIYRNYPDELAPSRLAVIAHGGTVLEFAVPIVLLLGHGRGDPVTMVGLALMIFLHGYI